MILPRPFVVGVFALVALGCKHNEGEEPSSCPVGLEGCPCTQGGVCDDDLVCADGTCQADSEGAGGAGGVGGVGGAGSAPDGPGVFDEAAFGEFPDCASVCGNSYERSPFDVQLTGVEEETVVASNGMPFSAVSGVIDGDDHSTGFGYDLDFIRVEIPARRVVEVVVSAPEGSLLDPYVSTYDPVIADFDPLFGWMTQNDLGLTAGTARTVIAAPTGRSDPWFVVVDDARNAFGAADPVGGAEYRYELRLRVLGEVALREIELDAGSAATSEELEQPGDLHYFRFVDPDHRAFRVDFEVTNDRFCGHVWQIDLYEGAGWIARGVTDDTPDDGCEPTLTFETNPDFFEPGTDAYALVVTDYLGRASAVEDEPFTYELRVEAVSQ